MLKSYIFSVIKTATMVVVLRKDCDLGRSLQKKTATLVAVLRKDCDHGSSSHKNTAT